MQLTPMGRPERQSANQRVESTEVAVVTEARAEGFCLMPKLPVSLREPRVGEFQGISEALRALPAFMKLMCAGVREGAPTTHGRPSIETPQSVPQYMAPRPRRLNKQGLANRRECSCHRRKSRLRGRLAMLVRPRSDRCPDRLSAQAGLSRGARQFLGVDSEISDRTEPTPYLLEGVARLSIGGQS